MKFNIPAPPSGGGEGAEEFIARLVSWLYILAEALNVTLSNLSEDNFSKGTRKKLFEGKENEDDNI